MRAFVYSPICYDMLMEFKTITGESEFLEVINLPQSIIYLTVNWSAPERLSRKIVFDVLGVTDLGDVPVYQIDCSNSEAEYRQGWLEKRITNKLLHAGWGETLFFKDGVLTDFIQYPFKLGYEQVKTKIESWLRD